MENELRMIKQDRFKNLVSEKKAHLFFSDAGEKKAQL